MTVIDVGYNYRHASDFCINRPNGLGCLDVLVIATPAFIMLNGQRIEVEPETVILFDSNTPQLYGGSGSPFADSWFHFTESDRSFFEELNIPFDTPLSGFHTKELSDIIMKMANERNISEEYFSQINSSYAQIFFYTLARLISPNRKPSISSELNDVRNAIFNMPSHDWNIDELCDMAGYSRSYFQHKYKEAFSSTPQQDVIESKILYAKYLLKNTPYRVNEIATLCGYTEEVHFMRTFKKKTGLTPMQYRKSFI